MEHIQLPTDRREFTSFKLVTLGAAGVSLGLLLKVLELVPKDRALIWATYLFAISIPFLIVLSMSSEVMENPRYRHLSLGLALFQTSLSIGRYALFAGIVCLLWHFNKFVALAMLTASIVCVFSYISFGVKMDKINPESPSDLS